MEIASIASFCVLFATVTGAYAHPFAIIFALCQFPQHTLLDSINGNSWLLSRTICNRKIVSFLYVGILEEEEETGEREIEERTKVSTFEMVLRKN